MAWKKREKRGWAEGEKKEGLYGRGKEESRPSPKKFLGVLPCAQGGEFHCWGRLGPREEWTKVREGGGR